MHCGKCSPSKDEGNAIIGSFLVSIESQAMLNSVLERLNDNAEHFKIQHQRILGGNAPILMLEMVI